MFGLKPQHRRMLGLFVLYTVFYGHHYLPRVCTIPEYFEFFRCRFVRTGVIPIFALWKNNKPEHIDYH